MLSTEEALKLVKETAEHIDIIEIGTPLIKHEGVKLIRVMREKFPDKQFSRFKNDGCWGV